MVSYSSLSRPGDRRVNEDAVGALSQENRHLFVVADGLGGHGQGAAASSYVVSQLLRAFEAEGDVDAPLFFTQTLRRIQRELTDMQAAEGCISGMRSTVAAAAVCGGMVTVAHVGDSRCYLLGPWGVRQRTLDHSVPQMLALAGEIREQDISHHPSRSKLLHALGDGDEELRIELLEARRGTKALLLCSDGLSNIVTDEEMLINYRAANDPEMLCRALMDLALERGARDNVTVLAVMR